MVEKGGARRQAGAQRARLEPVAALSRLGIIEAETDDDAVGFDRRYGLRAACRGKTGGRARYACRKTAMTSGETLKGGSPPCILCTPRASSPPPAA